MSYKFKLFPKFLAKTDLADTADPQYARPASSPSSTSAVA